jgi:SAM-dependent methyltransferase
MEIKQNIKEYGLSRAFYESRYKSNYMDSWPQWKKDRIKKLIADFHLPKNGVALDFGCGTGEWTSVLKDSLPSWEIWGTDISKTAVEKAIKKCPNCSFFHLGEASEYQNKFNLIFTHHVLEHVCDLNDSISLMNSLISRREMSYMFHILPCGNPDSYEYKICSLIQNGIEKENGNRFFFEDEGHVRRMTTQEISSIFSQFGFELTDEYYANQYHGAISWMIDSGFSFIKSLFDVNRASGCVAKKELIRQRRKLLFLCSPPFGLSMPRPFHYINLPLKIIIQKYLRKRSLDEWKTSCREKNGSEMYLLYGWVGSV